MIVKACLLFAQSQKRGNQTAAGNPCAAEQAFLRLQPPSLPVAGAPPSRTGFAEVCCLDICWTARRAQKARVERDWVVYAASAARPAAVD